MKVYTARGMSGRIKADVVAEAIRDKMFLEYMGLTVLDPVTEEGVIASDDVLTTSEEQMDIFWGRDKGMIREAHVVFDMTPHLKSEGVMHEVGYARYHLWKKVIRVYHPGKLPDKSSIAFYEDDYLTDNLVEAVEEAIRTHGTWWKRTKWRASMYNRCWLRAMKNKLMEWK